MVEEILSFENNSWSDFRRRDVTKVNKNKKWDFEDANYHPLRATFNRLDDCFKKDLGYLTFPSYSFSFVGVGWKFI